MTVARLQRYAPGLTIRILAGTIAAVGWATLQKVSAAPAGSDAVTAEQKTNPVKDLDSYNHVTVGFPSVLYPFAIILLFLSLGFLLLK